MTPRGTSVQATMAAAAAALRSPQPIAASVPIRVGVDLGTAYTVIVVTDEAGHPLAAAQTFADVVRDGIVWDFAGAQRVVRDLKSRVEDATGRELTKPRGMCVAQIFNHQTHHRGQVHALLTRAGEDPGATDLPFVL